MSATPKTTNLTQYVAYLEHANEYHALQLERAAAEIRRLNVELAAARGHLVIRAAS